ncbi:MAG TPA: cytochrome c [Xanthobacteraceae bacterium]|nr:cytochrome c [Xanthobacteraceae bacterium]
MIRRLVLACVAVGVVATAVIAQSDPVTERQGLLKQFGQVTRPVGGMLKGDIPFDLAVVQTALDTYVKNAKALPALFPAGSDVGKTAALPSVWQRKDEFDALFVKFGADAEKARGSITDLASLRANMPGVLRSCGTCHDSFRKKS